MASRFDPTAKIYHIFHRGKQRGPFSLNELSNKRLMSDMQVRREGTSEWCGVSECEELERYVNKAVVAHLRPPGRDPVPEPQLPPPPVGPPPEPPVPRSSIAHALGIFSILISVMLMCGVPLNVAGLVMRAYELEELRSNGSREPTILYVAGCVIFGGLLHSLILLASGIGLVLRKKWGLYWAIACAWGGLVSLGGNLVFMVKYDVVPLFEINDTAAIQEAAGILAGAGVSLVVFGGFYVTSLILLHLNRVKRSLR